MNLSDEKKKRKQTVNRKIFVIWDQPMYDKIYYINQLFPFKTRALVGSALKQHRKIFHQGYILQRMKPETLRSHVMPC